MNTIKGEIVNELEINKSRFITYLKHTDNVDDAKDYVSYVKALHPSATHHVVAMTIGKTGEYGQANDDGEPSGTAGLPTLDVFRKNDITNFTCVIVRYFGGVKLGAGGLVRAYSKSASTALKMLEITPIIDYLGLYLSFDYSFMNIIENRLSKYEIIKKQFSTDVTFIVRVPKDEVTGVCNQLISMTNNLIKIRILKNDDEEKIE
ncbi:MAG: YigZ family protein [Bacilli bacterium]|nr:YigZ family protein [Bacilli bacterium]MDY4053046.1 YigZ family protein [Bacilli bacterium]